MLDANETTEIIALLIIHGAHIELSNAVEETPLWKAAALGKEEHVKQLLAAGASPNVKNKDGHYALHKYLGNPNVLQPLLHAGADTQPRDMQK